ncbi:MAG: OmpA family protein [Flavobacteriaceae bacterium]
MKNIKFLLAIAMLSVTFSFAQEANRYTIKHLNDCNDELSNFGTSYYGKDKMIYSSPDRKHKIIKDIWNPNQQPFLDLFIGDISDDGEIVNSKQLLGEVRTKYHEADVVFTKDLQTVYFTRDNYYNNVRRKDEVGVTHLALYKADVISPGVWSNIVEFPYNNKDYSIGHPALSADENTLYFISDMPGTLGKTDVFKVSILGDNSYSFPENLGSTVNTAGKEMFSFVSESDILYYSSDGLNGKGGLDIYAYDLKNKSGKPTNLGSSINSFSDDFAFLIDESTNTGYFSSNRVGGKGDDDIYYFKQNKKVVLDCEQKIKGIVKNGKSNRRIPGALVVLYDANGNEIDEVIVGEDARFSFVVDCMSLYKVEASKDDFSIDSKEFESNPELDLNLNLKLGKEKIDVAETPIVQQSNPVQPVIVYEPDSPGFVANYSSCQGALDRINNIYFDLDKSFIREDAKYELNRVIRIMKRCTNYKVEASSHTDSRASQKYNNSLSQRRAQATVSYITRVGGIASHRIMARGYGENRLLNDCKDGVKCTEPEHQINRRTEFTIININR